MKLDKNKPSPFYADKKVIDKGLFSEAISKTLKNMTFKKKVQKIANECEPSIDKKIVPPTEKHIVPGLLQVRILNNLLLQGLIEMSLARLLKRVQMQRNQVTINVYQIRR